MLEFKSVDIAKDPADIQSVIRDMSVGENTRYLSSGAGSHLFIIDESTGRLFNEHFSTGAQTANLYRSHKAPPDLDSIPTDGFKIDTRANNLAGTFIITLWINGVLDSTIVDLNIEPSVINTWEGSTSAPILLPLINSKEKLLKRVESANKIPDSS